MAVIDKELNKCLIAIINTYIKKYDRLLAGKKTEDFSIDDANLNERILVCKKLRERYSLYAEDTDQLIELDKDSAFHLWCVLRDCASDDDFEYDLNDLEELDKQLYNIRS